MRCWCSPASPPGLRQSYSFLGYMRWVPALVGPFNAEPIIYTLLFVWSRNFAEQSVSIYGLFKLQAFYMPFAMLALSMVMGASPLPAITGILIGHLCAPPPPSPPCQRSLLSRQRKQVDGRCFPASAY